ncbi:MAG: hypothetical protein UHS54_01180 [Lachnospiraceae bacterium]|nr:hypothetical protein [Lachnospiraceae bacterium]
MIKGMKKYALLAGVTAMTAASLAGCGEKLDGTATVAVCNEEEINLGVVNLYTRYQQAQMYDFYVEYFGMTELFDTVADEETGETYGDTMKNDMMDAIKEMYVIKQHAADLGVEISEEARAAIDEAAERFMDENDASDLKKMGVKEEDVAALLELYSYQAWMYDAMIADVDTNVTDEEAAQSKITYVTISLEGTSYDDEGNLIDLTDDEKAAQEELAQQVLDAVMASENPAEADMNAIASGIDETLTASTATFGSTEDDTTDTVIKEAVEGLEDGAVVGQVLTSDDGAVLYVVRLDAAFDEEATESKKETIISQRQAEDYQTELDSWMEEAVFEIVEEVWDQIEITDSDVYAFKAEEEAAATEDTTTEDTTTEE